VEFRDSGIAFSEIVVPPEMCFRLYIQIILEKKGVYVTQCVAVCVAVCGAVCLAVCVAVCCKSHFQVFLENMGVCIAVCVALRVLYR